MRYLIPLVLLVAMASGQRTHPTPQNPFVTIDVIGPVYSNDADLGSTATALKTSCGTIPIQLTAFDELNGTWTLYCIRPTIEANAGR